MSRNPIPATRRDLLKAAALAGAATAATPLFAQAQGAASEQRKASFRLYDPDKLPASTGYSQIAEITGGKLVFIAGQVPRNAANELVRPGDFRAQLEQVFTNLDIAVRGAGGTFADIVKLNYYCAASIEPSQQGAIVEVRDRFVNTQAPPLSTFVFVSRLVRPDWLIEIEAVAVL